MIPSLDSSSHRPPEAQRLGNPTGMMRRDDLVEASHLDLSVDEVELSPKARRARLVARHILLHLDRYLAGRATQGAKASKDSYLMLQGAVNKAFTHLKERNPNLVMVALVHKIVLKECQVQEETATLSGGWVYTARLERDITRLIQNSFIDETTIGDQKGEYGGLIPGALVKRSISSPSLVTAKLLPEGLRKGVAILFVGLAIYAGVVLLNFL